jgi:hypothetical protein
MFNCNGCCLDRLRQQHGERLVHHNGDWYVQGEAPNPGQGEPSSLGGVPIRWIAWFMSTGHACGKRLPEGHEFFGEEFDPLQGSVRG